MNTLGIIGYGAIAQALLNILAEQRCESLDQVVLLVRPGREDITREQAQSQLAGASIAVRCISSVADLCTARPDYVVECAGHKAVNTLVEPCLAAGIDVVIASVGALADDGLFASLGATATDAAAQITLPSGAIGGIDALAAAKLAGIESLVYTGKKPAKAWLGTPAETAVDLPALTEAVVFFEGSARDAALAYPKNANVAATLALAGPGMDATTVRLVADPHGSANIHEYSVSSASVDYTMSLSGKVSALNPKTSLSTAYSLARSVLNRSSAVVI